MDAQHDGPVEKVELVKRSATDILRDTIINQAIQITALMAVADALPKYKAEILRLRGELEAVQTELNTIRERLGVGDGDKDRNG